MATEAVVEDYGSLGKMIPDCIVYLRRGRPARAYHPGVSVPMAIHRGKYGYLVPFDAFQPISVFLIDVAFSGYVHVYLVKPDFIGEDCALVHLKDAGEEFRPPEHCGLGADTGELMRRKEG